MLFAEFAQQLEHRKHALFKRLCGLNFDRTTEEIVVDIVDAVNAEFQNIDSHVKSLEREVMETTHGGEQ